MSKNDATYSLAPAEDGSEDGFLLTLATDALGQRYLIVPGSVEITGEDGDRFPATWVTGAEDYRTFQVVLHAQG